VGIHTGEDIGEFLVVVGIIFLAVRAPFRQECFHPIQTGFIQRLKDIERRKNERTGAAGGIQHRDAGDGLPERHEQIRPFAILDDILRELAEIQIQRDEVVDRSDFTRREFISDFVVTLAAGDDFAPCLGR